MKLVIIPYRIKHKATGLYYKPGRPNLSKETHQYPKEH